MHEADASQCVIAEQLSISQSAISLLFRKIAITTLKLAVHVASTSVLLPIASLVALLDLLSNYVCHISFQDLISHLDLNLSKKIIALHLKHLEIQKRIARIKLYISSQHMIVRFK